MLAVARSAKPVSAVRTDAEGTFSLAIPDPKQKWAVLINSNRTREGEEALWWFVWIDKMIPDSGTYLFANHNEVKAGSIESVVSPLEDLR